ncbi:unnamed protein product [Prorocentrum cordatum]|uniref:Uncharacterized protein n=1 Tax=Prorocentrum cordatum TaxID=2364126 RepID=A0ABN9W539_9DINO|nr:unnamed protein product [Polarella glacialis]
MMGSTDVWPCTAARTNLNSTGGYTNHGGTHEPEASLLLQRPGRHAREHFHERNGALEGPEVEEEEQKETGESRTTVQEEETEARSRMAVFDHVPRTFPSSPGSRRRARHPP